MREAELQSLRQVYARKIVASANASGDARLEAAFAAVHREDFLGSPPWRPIDTGRGYRSAPVSDPACVYQDVLFPLSLARGVNNGSPSLHARLMHALAPQPGQTIVHLGAGTGYYSAILSELVGPEGQVAAIEIDPLLAEKARTCLADFVRGAPGTCARSGSSRASSGRSRLLAGGLRGVGGPLPGGRAADGREIWTRGVAEGRDEEDIMDDYERALEDAGL